MERRTAKIIERIAKGTVTWSLEKISELMGTS
jgi:hypothetical protein